MKISVSEQVVTTRAVTIEVTAQDILALVRKRAHIPADAEVRVYVDVPGGGDWSNMEIDIAEHPVYVRAVWSATDEKQG